MAGQRARPPDRRRRDPRSNYLGSWPAARPARAPLAGTNRGPRAGPAPQVGRNEYASPLAGGPVHQAREMIRAGRPLTSRSNGPDGRDNYWRVGAERRAPAPGLASRRAAGATKSGQMVPVQIGLMSRPSSPGRLIAQRANERTNSAPYACQRASGYESARGGAPEKLGPLDSSWPASGHGKIIARTGRRIRF